MFKGSTTADRQFAYFTSRHSKAVYCYRWSTEEWKQLHPCPNKDSALVIIEGNLTAIGGLNEDCLTNELFSLRDGKWVKDYPPMNTARSITAAVNASDGEHIIVIGGNVRGDIPWTKAVELFQVNNRSWYKLRDVPQPLILPSATISDNQLYVTGKDDDGYSCSLEALLSSDQPIASESLSDYVSWTSLPRLPVTFSTAATLNKQIVIIGGWKDGTPVNAIHQLVDGKWVEIGSMSRGRYQCLVSSPTLNNMMIVGGWGTDDSVEECVVV